MQLSALGQSFFTNKAPARLSVVESRQAMGTQSSGLSSDQFNIRFGSAPGSPPTFEEFDQWIRTQVPDTTKLGRWLTTVMTDQTMLREGGEARGYELLDQDRFVLRCAIDKAKAIEAGSVLRKAALAKADDPFPHLNVGQTVATIGPVEVRKRQNGYSMSMPEGKSDAEPDKYQQMALIKTKRVAALPPSAFNELAVLREYLRQQDYIADADRDNVLISTDGQHFLQMDVVKNRTTTPLTPMTIVSLLNTCIYGVPPQCRANAMVQGELEATNRTILDNCLAAAKLANFAPLVRNTVSDSIIRRKIEYCGLKQESDLDWFYAQL